MKGGKNQMTQKKSWSQQRAETQKRLKKELQEAEIINRARADNTKYSVS